MTSKVDVIKRWHQESWANPPASVVAAAKKYYADDYEGMDKEGNVNSNKAAQIGMVGLLFSAFNDFKGVTHDVSEEEEGDGVILTFHFEGTHTGDFDLTPMGLGVIPATGKRVVTSEAKTWFMIEGDQIVSSRPISGGFEELLAAIGAVPPSA